MNYSERISEKRSSSFRHRLLRGSALLLFVAALTAGISTSTQASPFRNLHVPFTQPDGTKIEVIWRASFPVGSVVPVPGPDQQSVLAGVAETAGQFQPIA